LLEFEKAFVVEIDHPSSPSLKSVPWIASTWRGEHTIRPALFARPPTEDLKNQWNLAPHRVFETLSALIFDQTRRHWRGNPDEQ
jgi:hypothetical protein